MEFCIGCIIHSYAKLVLPAGERFNLSPISKTLRFMKLVVMLTLLTTLKA